MKKLLALILSLLLSMTVFVGCGDAVADDAVVTESTNYTLQFDAMYNGDEERLFKMVSIFDEEAPVTEEINNISFPYEGKIKVSDALNQNYYEASIEIVDENGTFLGWKKYVLNSVYDDFGNDIGTFEKADDTLYTTEEVLEMEVDCTVCFVAMWSDISEQAYEEFGY